MIKGKKGSKKDKEDIAYPLCGLSYKDSVYDDEIDRQSAVIKE